MTIERARVIKNAFPTMLAEHAARPEGIRLARRVPRQMLDARAEAERILAEANAEAERIISAARTSASTVAAQAAEEARAAETAKLAVGFLALRAREEERATKDLERTMELAVLLAERLVGENLGIDPSRIAVLAASALEEARGARRIRIEASPEDVQPLTDALGAIGHAATVEADPALPRGSLVVHTDLGRIDARLTPQLARLAKALSEALQ